MRWDKAITGAVVSAVTSGIAALPVYYSDQVFSRADAWALGVLFFAVFFSYLKDHPVQAS